MRLRPYCRRRPDESRDGEQRTTFSRAASSHTKSSVNFCSRGDAALMRSGQKSESFANLGSTSLGSNPSAERELQAEIHQLRGKLLLCRQAPKVEASGSGPHIAPRFDPDPTSSTPSKVERGGSQWRPRRPSDRCGFQINKAQYDDIGPMQMGLVKDKLSNRDTQFAPISPTPIDSTYVDTP